MLRPLCWGLLLPAFVWAAPAQAQRLKLAVMPVQLDASATGVPSLIDELLLTAVQHAGDFEVIGQDDISAMISLEQQKDLLGCDDASCLANLGGALGVDKIIVMKVARLGTEWVTTAKVLDILRARVDARSNYFVKGSAKQLLQDVPKIVAALFQNVPKEALVPEGGSAPAEVNPPPSDTGSSPPPPDDPGGGLGTSGASAPPPVKPEETTTVVNKPPVTPSKPSGPRGETGLNLRFDYDAMGPGWALGLGVDILTRGRIGIAIGMLFAWPVGVRGELRYFLLRRDLVRAYLGAGAIYFPVASLGLRGVVGAQVVLGPLRVGLDAGYEYFVFNADEFESMALTLGASVGVAF